MENTSFHGLIKSPLLKHYPWNTRSLPIHLIIGRGVVLSHRQSYSIKWRGGNAAKKARTRTHCSSPCPIRWQAFQSKHRKEKYEKSSLDTRRFSMLQTHFFTLPCVCMLWYRYLVWAAGAFAIADRLGIFANGCSVNRHYKASARNTFSGKEMEHVALWSACTTRLNRSSALLRCC